LKLIIFITNSVDHEIYAWGEVTSLNGARNQTAMSEVIRNVCKEWVKIRTSHNVFMRKLFVDRVQ